MDTEVRLTDDKATQQYFDSYVPNYRQERFIFAIRFLNEHAGPENSLIDVGCGTGKTLALIGSSTPVKKLVGLDVSESSLEATAKASGAETIHGSILNEAFVLSQSGRYDYAVLGAVLHHVIEKNRSECYKAAELTIANTLRMLKPGGHLFIMEPTWEPRFITWTVFWIKRVVSMVVPGRLHLGPSWVNIGHPIVSYYSEAKLAEMVKRQQAEIVEHYVHGRNTKLGGILKLANIGYILRRRS